MNNTASILAIVIATAASGCATAASMPRGPTVLQIGAVSEPSSFEKREAARSNDTFDKADKPDDAKRRKGAFWAGVGLASIGALGAVAFGIGGRVVQAQLANGYDNEDLSQADEDRLRTTGRAMNGVTITSASIGLFGVALLSVAYALDHSRCGDLPPKRADCGDRARQSKAEPAAAATESHAGPSAEPTGVVGPSPAPAE